MDYSIASEIINALKLIFVGEVLIAMAIFWNGMMR